MQVGVSIKPGTPVESILDFAADVDIILVMTVEPGFGGQKFMEDMMPKVEKLRKLFPDKDIEVDGGLGPTTIDKTSKAGANMIVAGSSIFKAQDRGSVIAQLKECAELAVGFCGVVGDEDLNVGQPFVVFLCVIIELSDPNEETEKRVFPGTCYEWVHSFARLAIL